MIEEILQSLGFDSGDIKIYLHLLRTGPTTAGNLSKQLGVVRSSLYGSLKQLENKGLVAESQKSGVKSFSAEDPEKINLLFAQHIETLQKSQKEFSAIIPSLKRDGTKLVSPKFQIFEGRESLQNALKDMLLYANLETQALWPQKQMVNMLSMDFFRYHNKERIRNNLFTRAIWPEQQVVSTHEHPYFGTGPEFRREIRIAPKEIDFTMGYWIYGNKVVLISSRKESFGFIIESAEFAEMLKSQFEVIWGISKKLITDENDHAEFLEESRRYRS